MMTKIYVLTEPDGEIRYVGKTIRPLYIRFNQHLASARRGEKGYVFNWIQSVLSAGYLPAISLIGEVAGNGSNEERAWIAYGRAEGWRLVNATDGGEGTLGWVPTKETRLNMSKACETRPPVSRKTRLKIGLIHKGQTAWNKGIKPSLVTRQKMSKAHEGKRLSVEHRKRQSEGKIGHIVSEDTRAKLRQANKGKKNAKGCHRSEETRQKLRQITLRRIALKGHPALGHRCTIEAKEKMSEARKNWWEKNKGIKL